MSAPPELTAFHVGIVVRDVDAVIDRYRRMLGLDRWNVRDRDEFTIAYGGREGTGLAFELIQPKDPASQMAQFLRERGEGVQHIGLWTPDLLGSVQAAVAEGATLVTGPFTQAGQSVVAVEAPAGAAPLRQLAFVDTGAATVRIEFIGPPADAGLREWLGEDFDRLIPSPPW